MTASFNFRDDRWALHERLARLAGRIVRLACKEVGLRYKKTFVGIVLTSNTEIQQLNKQYRGTDKPTNVLAFHQHDNLDNVSYPLVLGDIILAYEVIHREAVDLGKTFLAHACHMVAHGMLHLCGFDHQNDQEEALMQSKEQKILRQFIFV